MSTLKLSFKDGPSYRDFNLELDGTKVENVISAELRIRAGQYPVAVIEVELYDEVEIDADGVEVKVAGVQEP